MHGIELSAHFTLRRYTFSKCQQADIERSDDNLRPFSSFPMMGVFFSLFRAYLNFIHQTIEAIPDIPKIDHHMELMFVQLCVFRRYAVWAFILSLHTSSKDS